MDMNDETYNDPYANLYQTPKKITINPGNKSKNENAANNKNVFNPYEQSKPVEEPPVKGANEDLPKYVDLTKNAYAQRTEASGDEEEELPLLQELGICPENIKQKLISVLTFHKIDKQILDDADMTGPLLVFILFGISLVLVIFF
jgi:hypothetical protein